MSTDDELTDLFEKNGGLMLTSTTQKKLELHKRSFVANFHNNK
jgi:hypothetical protein